MKKRMVLGIALFALIGDSPGQVTRPGFFGVQAVSMGSLGGGATGCATGFAHCFSLPIDHTTIAAALTQYIAYADVTLGSSILNSGSGFDLEFTTTQNGGTVLPFECTYLAFNQTTGRVLTMVRIPSVSSTVDTTIYIQAGGSQTSCQAPSSALPASVEGMWHFETGIGLLADSSAANRTPTNSGVTSTTGKIGGGTVYVGGNNFTVPDTSFPTGTADRSVTFLLKSTATNPDGVMQWGTNSVTEDFQGLGISGSLDTFNIFGWGEDHTWSIPALTAGTWYHIAYTLIGRAAHIYVDGVESSTGGIATAWVTVLSGTAHVGAFTWGGHQMNGASLDELRVVSGTGYSAAWVAADALNQGNPASGSGIYKALVQIQ